VVTFDAFKRLLGDAATGLSDDQIRDIEGQADRLAAALFEFWRQRRPLHLHLDSRETRG
jgi:hypothetical protein